MADEPPPLDFNDEEQNQEEEEEEKSPFDAPKVEECIEEPQAQDESKLDLWKNWLFNAIRVLML